jgi:bifunctional UDP-N-acetylglucosamine pyrophosphorylase/glucosamine-1-phosphate N-acetyltransferase
MPLFTTRAIEDFPIGNILLRDHHAALADAGLAAGSRGHFYTHPHAWLTAEDVALLSPATPTLVDECRTPLAWFGDFPDAEKTLVASSSFLIVHPWDLLRANEQFVGALSSPKIEGDIHPHAVIEGVVHLGPGSRILPGVFIEGNVVIGANCKIGPNCYLRGSTSIGDKCHVGNAVEIKNSILLSGTSVGHLSYVGDSVIGEKVNFGAGTITSNFRHDGKNHRTLVDGVLVDTGRRKFGSIIGDGVHTGIHTSIYPGRKLWPGTSTRPGEIVQRDVQSHE